MSLFQKHFSIIKLEDVLKYIFVTFFIGTISSSYAPPFPLIVLLDKHKYIFNLDRNVTF